MSKRITFTLFALTLALTAPMAAQADRPDGATEPLRPKATVTDSGLEFSLPNTMPRGTAMQVTIVGPGDEVFVAETVQGPFFSWSPLAGFPEGHYRYEVRPILPPAAGAEGALGRVEAAARVRFRAGSFTWMDGTLTDRSAPVARQPSVEPKASLEGPSQETDLDVSDNTPSINFDDTNSALTDFAIHTNSESARFFQVAYGFTPVIDLRPGTGGDENRSLTVNAAGDVGLSDDTLFVDRSGGDVGIGTTMPEQELHVVSPDGGDIKLSGSPQGESWDIAIASFDGSLVISDAAPGAGNIAIRIEKGVPNQTLHLDSAGRVGIGTDEPERRLHVAGSGRIDGDVALGSSRTMKTGFGTVNPTEMLARVADLPLASWRYKSEAEDSRHIGPFAEDFQRLFGLGDGETISVIDAQGVTLAAIQGLQQELAEKNAEIAQQNDRIADLATRLTALEARLDNNSEDQ